MGKASQGGREAGARFVSIMMAVLLAVTMLPAAGLSSAFADEPVERPATSGGDVALESTNADAGAEAQVPVAEEREDGMLAADGLLYTVADGGLSLAGFDGDVPEGVLAVPAAVSVDGKDTPVVAVDIAEGQIADKVVVLSLPQGIRDIDTGSLATAFPVLLSVEVAAASDSSLPAASGAASMRAAYSTSGGMLFRPTEVTFQSDDGAIETVECKELVWAPPALVSARVPVECRAIAEGAFADARDLKTVVAFGTMERIADGAFSIDQMEGSKVVVPASSPVVAGEDAERVSASMALMGDAGQKERRSAWHEAGWRSDDIVMGKPCGALTETVAVDAEGCVERTDLRLISYPGMHPEAMDVKHPDENGDLDMADAGLAFTVKSGMTASVAWQGDKAATPSHVEIPAAITIDDVTYPVTEIAASGFEGAAFLESVAIPEGVTAVGQDAFKDCPSLAGPALPITLSRIVEAVPDDAPEPITSETNHLASSQTAFSAGGMSLLDETAEAFSIDNDISGYSMAYANVIKIFHSAPGIYEGLNISPSTGVNARSSAAGIEVYTNNGSTFRGIAWSVYDTDDKKRISSIKVTLLSSSGGAMGVFYLNSLDGWVISGVSVDGGLYGNASGYFGGYVGVTALFVGMVRDEAVGSSELALASHKHAAADVTSGTFSADRIPNLSAAKITSGTMSGDRISSLAASKLTGTIDAARLPSSVVTTANKATTLSEYATQKWVMDKGYLTSSSLSPYLKTADADAKYQPKGSYAAADHAHDARYYTESETDAKLGEKVDRSEFGTISYEGLDDGDENTYPTSYRKGGMPSIHEPEREGYEFAGWQWSRGSVSGDGGNLGGAFSEAGDVTLTATWREVVPEANHFFSDGSPLTAGDNAEYQSHVIKVRLADFGGDALSRVAFERNDAAGILQDGAEVRLWVGGDPDVFTNGTQLTLGQTAATSAGWRMQLAQRADESWGVYVGVRIRTADVAADRIQTSYAAGSYVVSLVKMSYEFA